MKPLPFLKSSFLFCLVHTYSFGIEDPNKEYNTLKELECEKMEESTDSIFEVLKKEDALEVKIDGTFFARYNFHKLGQPILWPILGPNGIRMLRDYPMKSNTPGEAKDHPHHRGLFIGHQGISGANFWHNQNENSGTVEHLKVIENRSGEDRALIKTLNAWKLSLIHI